MSAVIDRLEGRPVVARQRPPFGRRTLQLEVALTGRNAVEWSTGAIADRVGLILEALTPADRPGLASGAHEYLIEPFTEDA